MKTNIKYFIIVLALFQTVKTSKAQAVQANNPAMWFIEVQSMERQFDMNETAVVVSPVVGVFFHQPHKSISFSSGVFFSKPTK